MTEPILSICIPTYNRCNFLKETLENITSNYIFLNSFDIEIVISDNNSTDSTKTLCEEYAKNYPDKISYFRQETNIFDKNFTEVLKLARGKFAKLSNDTLIYRQNAPENFIKIIKDNLDSNVIFFTNRNNEINDAEFNLFKTKDVNVFLKKVGYMSTWIGGICVKTEKFKELKNPDRFSDLYLAQVDFMARLLNKSDAVSVDGKFCDVSEVKIYRQCSTAKVYGKNYAIILKSLAEEGIIEKKTYEYLIKDMLINHINKIYFHPKASKYYDKTGYFKNLYSIYKRFPYFYINLILSLIKKIRYPFIRLEKTKTHKILKILFIEIKF